jgi:protein O-GlcNAc transferase
MVHPIASNRSQETRPRCQSRRSIIILRTGKCLIPTRAGYNLGNALKGRGDLNGAIICYRRVLELKPDFAEAVGPPPSLKEGFATFGSFHNPAQITPEVVAVWARILRATPTSRLVMKYRGLGDPAVKKLFLDLFAAHGVEPHRLDLLPSSSYSDYLATYHRVDVALDPFPFSGSTITCESLWMGVPVVTWPGETFAGRHSLSHLSSVGLTETIARNPDEYVELAISMAGDPVRLSALRSGLRERMAASPLCDGK